MNRLVDFFKHYGKNALVSIHSFQNNG